jgi:predicted Rossmann fold flavoprotein
VIVGGGAAGFFAAITCAESQAGAEIVLLERGPEFLTKVRISGGGRCNVTHACFDPRELAERFPRGGKALIGAFERFQPRDTIAWFEARGVRLKVEADGRVFPTSDDSRTIMDCLIRAASQGGVQSRLQSTVEKVNRQPGGGFRLTITGQENVNCERLLLATGGCRAAAAGQIAVSLGHTLETPVPSLFTFQMTVPWLHELAGVTIQDVAVSVPGTRLRERGPLLVTHWGLSGPVILRMSAWGARVLHRLGYRFELQVNWLPNSDAESIGSTLCQLRDRQPARFVVRTPLPTLPGRLWEQLVLASGIARETRWAELSRTAVHGLVQQLICTRLPVTGKSLNKDEFVTCGGVRLAEIDFQNMESRKCAGLYFAGELLDIDGVTGGFNFQAAWTTGWIAGRAMAQPGDRSL